MLLTYSNDMQKAMEIKAEIAKETDKSNIWFVHTLKINRRNCVIFMNTATRFSMILWGLKATDYKKIDFKEHLGNLLREYYINSDIILAYLFDCGDITVAKNSDRSATAQLNRNAIELKYIQDHLDKGNILQIDASKWLNNRLFNVDGKYKYPAEVFLEMLKSRYNVPFYNIDMLRLKITLDYPDFEISREISLPANMNFYGLHAAIQSCFNWQNCHLYEFIAYGENGEPVMRIKSEFEDEEFGDIPTRNDTECSVYEMLCKYADIWYIYDMGDYWQHKIELLEVTKEHENVVPTCLKVTGKAPPEDCGGIGGYQELLQQIADGDKEMIEWAESMKWDEQSAEEISRKLKWKIR